MSNEVPKLEQATTGLDESKRKALTRLVAGTAFVAPIVASFQNVLDTALYRHPGALTTPTPA